MITEDYVSFEVAKLLKEKGFDWECLGTYSTGDKELSISYECPYSNDLNDDMFIAAPTLQMAIKWLREEFKCIITCLWEFENYIDGKPDFSSIVWSYNIAIVKYNSARTYDRDYFDMDSEKENYLTYEQACEAAIKYCLINLI